MNRHEVRGTRHERTAEAVTASCRVPRAAYLAAALAIAMLMPSVASACPVCYGDPNSPMVKGANNGVLVLLGIVAFVQIGFVALFVSFWKRAQHLRRKRDQFRLIEGGAR